MVEMHKLISLLLFIAAYGGSSSSTDDDNTKRLPSNYHDLHSAASATTASRLQNSDAGGGWPAVGGSSFRLSQRSVTLPDPNTGVAITQRVTIDGLSPFFTPLITSDDTLAVVIVGTDTVVFLDNQNFETVYSLNVTLVCTTGRSTTSADSALIITTQPVLDPIRNTAILPFQNGAVCAINTANIEYEEGVKGGIGSVAWMTAPNTLQGNAVGYEPVVAGENVFFVDASGNVDALSAVDGSHLWTSAVSLCTPLTTPLTTTSSTQSPAKEEVTNSDTILSPPTQLDVSGNLLVVSAYGCVTALASNGTLLWTITNASISSNNNAGNTNNTHGLVLTAPVVDPTNQLAFWAQTGGNICCVQTMTGGNCIGWSSVCVNVLLSTSTSTTAAAAGIHQQGSHEKKVGSSSSSICSNITLGIYSGIALSPSSFDFHLGELYVVASDGTLIGVKVQTAEISASEPGSIPGGIVVTAPIVVPDAWGADNNALVVIASSCSSSSSSSSSFGDVSSVGAWSIGNNGARSDDDPTDDDGASTTGFIWQINLPTDIGGLLAQGAALFPDGRLLIGTGSGDVLVLGPSSTDAVEVGTPWVEGTIIGGVLVGSLAVFAVAFYISHRQRLAAATLAQEEEGEEEEEEDAATTTTNSMIMGGGGGDDNDDDLEKSLLGRGMVVNASSESTVIGRNALDFESPTLRVFSGGKGSSN